MDNKEFNKKVKQFGTPKFKEGDRVTSHLFDGVATIKQVWHNGFSWMAYFYENEVGCSLNYLTDALTVYMGREQWYRDALQAIVNLKPEAGRSRVYIESIMEIVHLALSKKQ